MDQDELADRIAQAGDEGWTTLDLSDQGMEYLPAEIGNVTSLIELDLWGNGLTALPSEMKKLIDQGVLVLVGNPFRR